MTSLHIPEAIRRLSQGDSEVERICCGLYESHGSKSLEILGELGIMGAEVTLLYKECREDYKRMSRSLNEGSALTKIQQAKLLQTLSPRQ